MSIMTGVADFLEQCKDTRYTFVLGDTVWSPVRLKKVLERKDDGFGVTYFSSMKGIGGETFAVKISSDEGDHYLRSICQARPKIVSPFGNKHIKVHHLKRSAMDFENARLNDLFSHILATHKKDFEKIKIKPVDDIDNDEEYEEVHQNIIDGVYDRLG